jgi:hypothetical protein
MAIEFNHFSPQAFERMVQALCVHVLGPGVIIFGAGADGGREATFEGELPFHSSVDRWKGYTVVQAKCRERLRNNHEDADWLCDQLRHDLDKFLDISRNLLKPEFYILASNVTLSPQEKRGEKAKLHEVFKSYKGRLRLKSYAVWSVDELRAYLENAEDVRRAYIAWLTPSDVLAELINSLSRPNLSRLIPLALARDLRNERGVRLKDAGQETDKAIFLEDVFVDLPLLKHKFASVRLTPDMPLAGRGDGVTGKAGATASRFENNFLYRVVERAAEKLDPQTIQGTLQDRPTGGDGPLPNRIVLLGGPGQGKSTLSQFLVQMERARMLSTQDALRINKQTKDLIGPILQRASSDGLWLDGPIRFPIRIDLPGFADALKRANDRQHNHTLLAHITGRLSREVDVTISVDDLRAWLANCPSLIILDGLDEVPPTANRTEVVRAVEALWDDLNLQNSDALVLVTTRPQGYNHDLSPRYWEHWELGSLGPDDVKRYASSLARVRISDPHERTKILAVLGTAAIDQSTSALLASPLQVTILFGIALLKEDIPRDRWDLFDRYYQSYVSARAESPVQ